LASRIQLAKELLNQLSIQTFHSLFWKVLRSHGYLLGASKHLRLLLPQDESALRNDATDDDRGANISPKNRVTARPKFAIRGIPGV
jgi:DNA helicase-2/ATP-dependent DNA helicase PcrA